MYKSVVPKRFIARIEALMGAQLRAEDLTAIKLDLPISELETLKQWTKTDSSTLNKPGVDVLQDQVSEKLERLGFKVKTIKGEERFSQLVIGERKGKKNKAISLITHTDTVLGNFREFHYDLNAKKAFGSGVIDNKGGVVVGLSALERLLKNHPETEYTLRFICSPNEEMGSIAFTSVFRELGLDTEFAFGLEPALDNGSVIHQRRGNRWYEVNVTGKEAHAGRSYGQHANAAHDLARKISELASLTNYRKHVSVNVGRIEGGKDKFNIVCGQAHAKIDFRFPSLEVRDHLHKKIEKILLRPSEHSTCGNFETKTEYKIVDDCPPFSLTRKSKRLARTYAALVSQLENRKIYSQPAGGAGDVNYLSNGQNLVLDGLGPVGGEMHTTDEFLWVDSLTTRSQALAGFLKYLQKLA